MADMSFTKFSLKKKKILSVCVCACCGLHVEVRGQRLTVLAFPRVGPGT